MVWLIVPPIACFSSATLPDCPCNNSSITVIQFDIANGYMSSVCIGFGLDLGLIAQHALDALSRNKTQKIRVKNDSTHEGKQGSNSRTKGAEMRPKERSLHIVVTLHRHYHLLLYGVAGRQR